MNASATEVSPLKKAANESDWKIPWSGRGLHYNAEEIAAVVEAMTMADPLSQGRYQETFEKSFRELIGSRHAFAVSNGTAALELAAMLSGIGPGDEVIIPAHTFAATAIPFARRGARIVWADINPRTFVISAEAIQRVVTHKTKGIVVVHLYGLMADMNPILEIARKKNIIIIEDAAQAIGASYQGRKAGSLGDLGCFSFHSHKNISTLGEGGMLTVNRDDWASLVPGLRHNGMHPYAPDRASYWLPAMTNVDFDLPQVWPYKFCLGEVQCALGSKMLERLEMINEKRRQRGRCIREALSNYPELIFQEVPKGFIPSGHLLPARYEGKGHRDKFIERMAFHHRIKVIVQYYPLYRYPLFQKAGLGEAHCPETDKFFDNMVSFPFHEGLTEEQIAILIEATKETLDYLRGHGRA